MEILCEMTECMSSVQPCSTGQAPSNENNRTADSFSIHLFPVGWISSVSFSSAVQWRWCGYLSLPFGQIVSQFRFWGNLHEVNKYQSSSRLLTTEEKTQRSREQTMGNQWWVPLFLWLSWSILLENQHLYEASCFTWLIKACYTSL